LRSIDISIHESTQGFEGSLRLEAKEGPKAVREVHAQLCSEVASGLAIVAAIALGGAPEQSAPEPEGQQSPTKPVATAQERTPTLAPDARPDAKPRFVTSSFKHDPIVDVQAGPLRFDRVRNYTLGAGADFGLLPGLLVPRYEFSISLANLVTPPSMHSYLVGPILEVFWTVFGPGSVHHQGFTTRAFGFEAGVRSCSAFTYDSQGLTLLGCGEFGVGGLGMDTKDLLGVTARDKSTGFGTAGLVLESQYRFGSVFLLDLRLAGRAQLGGLSAERADGSEIFGAQLFGAYAQLGLGLQF
jgi:hypothetical protein